jgi:hypothetical protein
MIWDATLKLCADVVGVVDENIIKNFINFVFEQILQTMFFIKK